MGGSFRRSLIVPIAVERSREAQDINYNNRNA
jgi:hypothetical protein